MIGPRVLGHVRQVGGWALTVATAGVAAAAIKALIGLH